MSPTKTLGQELDDGVFQDMVALDFPSGGDPGLIEYIVFKINFSFLLRVQYVEFANSSAEAATKVAALTGSTLTAYYGGSPVTGGSDLGIKSGPGSVENSSYPRCNFTEPVSLTWGYATCTWGDGDYGAGQSTPPAQVDKIVIKDSGGSVYSTFTDVTQCYYFLRATTPWNGTRSYKPTA